MNEERKVARNDKIKVTKKGNIKIEQQMKREQDDVSKTRKKDRYVSR